MSRSYVLDASMALAWLLPDEAQPATDALLRATGGGALVAIAPFLLPAEVANSLGVAERRGRIAGPEADRVFQDFLGLSVEVIGSSTNSLQAARSLARRWQIALYDALYLELALSRGVALATLDRRLAEAATQAGIELLR